MDILMALKIGEYLSKWCKNLAEIANTNFI